MTRKRCALLLTALALTACGSDEGSTPKPTGEQPKKAPSSYLALPITAPIGARERMRQQVRKINVGAQRRRRQMDSVDPNK